MIHNPCYMREMGPLVLLAFFPCLLYLCVIDKIRHVDFETQCFQGLQRHFGVEKDKW